MADRPSIKDILAAARKGGAAQPTDSASSAAVPEPSVPAAAQAPVVAKSAASVPPTAASLGRPLTLKEKLAAARAGGTAAPDATASVVATTAPAPVAEVVASGEKTVPASAESLGRPMTLKEKLAAARGGAAPAGDVAPAAPSAAKPAAAKAVTVAKVARELPPLQELTDPKDLAEALRQTGAKRTQELQPAAKVAAAKKAAEVKVVPGRPGRENALVEGTATRRQFHFAVPWIVAGWVAFTAGMAALTAMCGRFMFPNVLAEPPSTIKVGVPGDFGRGEVNEKWKAEWGFWIVRSDLYNGQDIIYALQSVCTHLGCPPNWLGGEQKFKCPCHGSGFYVSGVNFEGPAPRPLERFRVAIADDGQILVDKSQKFQEELAQWSDPDSFLPAV